jgi:chemotaxis protein MotB
LILDKSAELAELDTSYQNYRAVSERQMVTLLSQLDKKGEELSEKEEALLKRAEKLKELQEKLDQQTQTLNLLRRTIQEALVAINRDDVKLELKNGKVYVSLSENLLFASGSSVIDPKGANALESFAKVLKENDDINIEIIGHTDSIPIRSARFSDNWDLSTARASSLIRLLAEKYEIPGKRLTAAGRGEYEPLGSNETPEGRAKNRRLEIVLSPKLDEIFKLVNEDLFESN